MKQKLFIILLLACQPLSSLLTCQETTPALTLGDIYKNNLYKTESYGPVRWSSDSRGYLTLEANREAGGNDIIMYEARSGKRSVICSAESLVPEGQEKPIEIYDYLWSDDNSRLLIFTNTKRVWRYNTRGDYWVFDIGSGRLRQMGKTMEPSSMMFAKFSPDGTQIAYVSRNNIYVENIETNRITRITADGSDNIINGTFDWVYEEELGCRDGFRWSPDGTKIAYWQSDTEGTGTFYMINNIDSVYPILIPLPYPKVGTANSAVRVGVVPSEGGETRWFEIPGDPRNNYLARMDFIPGSEEVMIQQLNRLQNRNRIWIGNTITMELDNIHTEQEETFLNIHDNIRWLSNESYFTWSSEKEGWRHLYLISRDGRTVRPVTRGEYDVITIYCIDEKGGYVYYSASPENFTQQYLFRSRLDGKGSAEKITPAHLAGHNTYQISDNARWAIHTYANSETPNRISLITLPDHKEVKVLKDNSVLKQRYEQLGLERKSFFRVDIGEEVLDAWMIRPANFDPSLKYPVIFYVYGEPASSTVQDNWNREDLWHQYMAQKGYIVISIDNRGTKVPRGTAFRKSIYRQIGILASADQAEAARQICSMYSFIDPERLGIWGWSGGGQMTLNCMFRYPELYRTGIAVAFVSDQRLYDNIYQERYMGLIEENAEGYYNGSPLNFAKNLSGNLMIIHGTADDNVHYQSFEMLTNELIKHNKLFSMMAYPMRAHGLSERENSPLHLRETMSRYWMENLPAGGR